MRPTRGFSPYFTHGDVFKYDNNFVDFEMPEEDFRTKEEGVAAYFVERPKFKDEGSIRSAISKRGAFFVAKAKTSDEVRWTDIPQGELKGV